MNTNPTILTGDRPTGQLHLGHYVGSLRQRVQLQHDHQQFILIADLQGLTDNGSDPQKISSNIFEVMADYLAVGIDPHKTTICLQSALPALAELSALYMNIVTVARVERNPTVKSEIAQKGFSRSLPVGFLAYPISQAADITAFKAGLVPVGDDQLPMIEQTNEIVHKMNSLTTTPVLQHCRALLSDVSRLPGIDAAPRCQSRWAIRSRSRPAKSRFIVRSAQCIPTRPICGSAILAKSKAMLSLRTSMLSIPTLPSSLK